MLDRSGVILIDKDKSGVIAIVDHKGNIVNRSPINARSWLCKKTKDVPKIEEVANKMFTSFTGAPLIQRLNYGFIKNKIDVDFKLSKSLEKLEKSTTTLLLPENETEPLEYFVKHHLNAQVLHSSPPLLLQLMLG